MNRFQIRYQYLPVPYRPLIDKPAIYSMEVVSDDAQKAIAGLYLYLESNFDPANIGEVVSVERVVDDEQVAA